MIPILFGSIRHGVIQEPNKDVHLYDLQVSSMERMGARQMVSLPTKKLLPGLVGRKIANEVFYFQLSLPESLYITIHDAKQNLMLKPDASNQTCFIHRV